MFLQVLVALEQFPTKSGIFQGALSSRDGAGQAFCLNHTIFKTGQSFRCGSYKRGMAIRTNQKVITIGIGISEMVGEKRGADLTLRLRSSERASTIFSNFPFLIRDLAVSMFSYQRALSASVCSVQRADGDSFCSRRVLFNSPARFRNFFILKITSRSITFPV